MSSHNSTTNLPSSSSKLQPFTQTSHRALELTDTLGEIFSHVGTPHELLQYRFVCQKWNDVIVHSLNTKWKNSFPLRLRYGPEVPLSLNQSEAKKWAIEILAMTLIGSTIPFSFDTVVVDNDFYLAGLNSDWQHFLEIYGETIRHLKFDIRSGKEPNGNSPHHYVWNCAEVVSAENLRAAFYAVPNLESLDLSIRFTHYGAQEQRGGQKLMFPDAGTVVSDVQERNGFQEIIFRVTELPQLKKLTKITLREPQGTHYNQEFLKEIIGLAPNLTAIYIKWSEYLSTYAYALRSLLHLDNSITTLGISMTDSSTRFAEIKIMESGFSRFHLTKLELNNITGTGVYLEQFLESQSPTLTTLILGDRVTPNMDPRSYYGPTISRNEGVTTVIPLGTKRHRCSPLYRNPLSLPLIMDSLKILEINLPKFKLAPITSYPNQFPSLEELTFSTCEDTMCAWKFLHLQHLLPGEPGQSHTLKKFSLLGPMLDADQNAIVDGVRSTFPFAEFHFRP